VSRWSRIGRCEGPLSRSRLSGALCCRIPKARDRARLVAIPPLHRRRIFHGVLALLVLALKALAAVFFLRRWRGPWRLRPGRINRLRPRALARFWKSRCWLRRRDAVSGLAPSAVSVAPSPVAACAPSLVSADGDYESWRWRRRSSECVAPDRAARSFRSTTGLVAWCSGAGGSVAAALAFGRASGLTFPILRGCAPARRASATRHRGIVRLLRMAAHLRRPSALRLRQQAATSHRPRAGGRFHNRRVRHERRSTGAASGPRFISPAATRGRVRAFWMVGAIPTTISAGVRPTLVISVETDSRGRPRLSDAARRLWGNGLRHASRRRRSSVIPSARRRGKILAGRSRPARVMACFTTKAASVRTRSGQALFIRDVFSRQGQRGRINRASAPICLPAPRLAHWR